jgi:Zinc finger, C2H2 type
MAHAGAGSAITRSAVVQAAAAAAAVAASSDRAALAERSHLAPPRELSVASGETTDDDGDDDDGDDGGDGGASADARNAGRAAKRRRLSDSSSSSGGGGGRGGGSRSIRPFRCDACGKTFRLHAQCTRHQRVHSDEYPLVCAHANCGRRFKYAESLRVHRCLSASAAVEEHRCSFPACGRTFSTACNLAQHVQRHLDKAPAYPCRVCGQVLSDMSNRNAHERRHCVAGTERARPYPCTHPGCGKTFTQAGHLRTHQTAHSDSADSTHRPRPRVHRCPFDGCDKAYMEATALRQHQRTKGHRVGTSRRYVLGRLADALPLVALASAQGVVAVDPDGVDTGMQEKPMSNWTERISGAPSSDGQLDDAPAAATPSATSETARVSRRRAP